MAGHWDDDYNDDRDDHDNDDDDDHELNGTALLNSRGRIRQQQT